MFSLIAPSFDASLFLMHFSCALINIESTWMHFFLSRSCCFFYSLRFPFGLLLLGNGFNARFTSSIIITPRHIPIFENHLKRSEQYICCPDPLLRAVVVVVAVVLVVIINSFYPCLAGALGHGQITARIEEMSEIIRLTGKHSMKTLRTTRKKVWTTKNLKWETKALHSSMHRKLTRKPIFTGKR